MKKKYSTFVESIIDACSGEKIKLREGQMVVMNGQGIFFVVGNIMGYDTYIKSLSDVCPRFDVEWKGEE